MAACTQPLTTIFSLGASSTGLVIGTSANINRQIEHVDWAFTPTTDGFFSATYQGSAVGVELTPTGGRLAIAPRTLSTLELQLDSSVTQGSNLIARVTGTYTVGLDSTRLVPFFSPGGASTTNQFVLGAQLVSVEGAPAISPLLLSEAAAVTPTSLPGNVVSVLWSVGRMATTTASTTPAFPVIEPMGDACADPVAVAASDALLTAQSTQNWWTWGVVAIFIILIIIAFVIAFFMRRTEVVRDPRAIPLALSIARS